ncbi:flagellar motor stator protein MotA [Pseudomonas sp. S 311-6]|nr:flagellar motor stator protein MotA [Pseudomonas sp. S 311-6]MCP1633306.1 chemotaxis protein MotA [Kerstersia gyiorum]MCP1636177.1 chemotaxis protein MotA [Kerstersia gyiorum]MCP1671256.1 chemotaxis protein MotA [Kerstersia gyiorum]MCP1679089.1 chemotaxis protein MotA [Kerstersia gyiorum]
MGGHWGALYQPFELVVIGGAGLGAFIAANTGKTLKLSVQALVGLVKPSPYNKAVYMQLIAFLYVLLAKVRRDGWMAIESHIEDPANSELFAQYPLVQKDARLQEFLLDYLRLMISGNTSAFEIEALMDEEIETYSHERSLPSTALHNLADGLPAFGIVAAVLGVIKALAAIDQPPAVLGDLISKAMVGTFLGILMAYGFVSPLAAAVDRRNEEAVKILECVKVTLMASLHGYPPQMAVEFGRKVLFADIRPSFAELEEHVRQAKGTPADKAA